VGVSTLPLRLAEGAKTLILLCGLRSVIPYSSYEAALAGVNVVAPRGPGL